MTGGKPTRKEHNDVGREEHERHVHLVAVLHDEHQRDAGDQDQAADHGDLAHLTLVEPLPVRAP